MMVVVAGEGIVVGSGRGSGRAIECGRFRVGRIEQESRDERTDLAQASEEQIPTHLTREERVRRRQIAVESRNTRPKLD